MYLKTFFLIAFIAITCANTLFASDISGKITDETSGLGLKSITVKLKELNIKTFTNSEGEYSFKNVSKGNFSLELSGQGIKPKTEKIEIGNENSYTFDFSVEYRTINLADMEVYSSSRRLQKITEAPSAMSVITSEQLKDATSHGQIGKVMENLPGVDVVQSGMNDFNINVRGFNNSINRRTLVLIDGRDPSTPMLNLIEWNSLQTNMADLKKIEVVRGPGSALYGANAYNGVINITTYSPKDVLGTRVSVTRGDYNSRRLAIRNAGKINDKLYYKINLGDSQQKQSWVTSRDTAHGGHLEYAGLKPDLIGNRPGNGFITNIDSLFNAHRMTFSYLGSLRLDYELNDEATLTGEVGYNRYGNEYFANQTGRILIPDIESPFARLSFNSTHWSINSIWRNRYAVVPQIVLNAPASSGENSNVFLLDAQWNNQYLNDKLKVIAGASIENQSVITASAGSAPLLSPDSVNYNYFGLYGQLEYKILDNLNFVFAGRVDNSKLYNSTQFSPKFALVWEPVKNQTFRLTLNRSFLRPNYSDYGRLSPAGAPLNLHALDSSIAAEFGVDKLGLETVKQLNVGNPKIGVETAWSYEAGYKGVISDKLFITADVYFNQRSNFISNPLPGLAFSPLRYSSDAANQKFKEAIGSFNYDAIAMYPKTGQASILVAPVNIGLVNEYGTEIGFNYYLNDNWLITANYSYLAIDIIENNSPTNKILPNTSPNRVNVGFEYNDKIFNLPFKIIANARGVESFKWIAGFYEGNVPGYFVVNLSGNIDLTKEINLGFNVFNLLDKKHYEIFGGTYLRRYGSVSLSYTL